MGKGAELEDEPGLTGTTGTTDWPGVTVTVETTVETETDGQVTTGQPLTEGWTGELLTPLLDGVAGDRGMTTVVLWLGLVLTGTTTVVED